MARVCFYLILCRSKLAWILDLKAVESRQPPVVIQTPTEESLQSNHVSSEFLKDADSQWWELAGDKNSLKNKPSF